MFISDVEANTGFGRDLLKESNPEDIINFAIELPLRKACKIFLDKNIKTIMSSANKHNIVNSPDEIIEKKDVWKTSWEFMVSSNPPTFLDAGKGYAWIMLDFNSLSDENKDWLFSLEARKNQKGEPIGEKGVWFVQPRDMKALEVKVNLDHNPPLIEHANEDEPTKDITLDKRFAEFKKRRILLAYNERYPNNVVILRYPIDKNTTVAEVEEYFSKLAESFKDQIRENEITSQELKELKKRQKEFEESQMDIN